MIEFFIFILNLFYYKFLIVFFVFVLVDFDLLQLSYYSFMNK